MQGLSVQCISKAFQKTNISYPLISAHTWRYVNFSKNFAYVLNRSSLVNCWKDIEKIVGLLCDGTYYILKFQPCARWVAGLKRKEKLGPLFFFFFLRATTEKIFCANANHQTLVLYVYIKQIYNMYILYTIHTIISFCFFKAIKQKLVSRTMSTILENVLSVAVLEYY